MGKTVFNPITTKWRGAIGGFRYSVVRGKQVIAERASAVKNPRTEGQMKTRMRFKLASQFSALWKDIIELNLSKITRDGVIARATATKVAFGASTAQVNAAAVELGNFANDFNAKNNQPVGAGITLTFTSSEQKIVAPDGDNVVYKIVAFDEQNTPIGTSAQAYISDGSAKVLDLPVIFGNAVRYDVMAFSATPTEGAQEYTGRLSDILGENDAQELSNEYYSLVASAAADSLIVIHGIVTDSYLVA